MLPGAANPIRIWEDCAKVRCWIGCDIDDERGLLREGLFAHQVATQAFLVWTEIELHSMIETVPSPSHACADARQTLLREPAATKLVAGLPASLAGERRASG